MPGVVPHDEPCDASCRSRRGHPATEPEGPESRAHLRIGIDVRPALARKTGDRTYILNLVRALAEVDPKNEYFLLTDEPPRAGLFPSPPTFHPSILPALARWMFTPISLPLFAWRQKLDVVHVQYLIPPICPCPVVTTIHDVTFERFPRWFPLKHRMLLRALIPFAVMQARRVITGSQATSRDLLACYGGFGLTTNCVTVTPYGPDPSMRPATSGEIERIKRVYALDRPYVLAVGVQQPRKNFAALAAAWARVVQRHPSLPHVLAVFGKPGWGAPLPSTPNMRFCGYADDGDLPALYSGCDLFVHPALYEGFGLTPLEAMACGAPVASSTGGSLAEVVGDAALTFDPEDSEAIAVAIEGALTDVELRASLRRRGLSRAGEFSWKRTAEQTLQVYQEVAARA